MLLAFDLDRTLLKKNSGVVFFRYLYKKRVISLFSCFFCVFYYIQHLYFNLSLRDLHERIFNRVLKGKMAAPVLEQVAPFWANSWKKLCYFPVWSSLRRGQHLGWPVLIASSSPDFLVKGLAEILHVKEWIGSTYEIDKEGCFCRILLVDGKEKARYMQKIREKLSVTWEETEGYSDSHLDLPFLEAVGMPVVVNPDAILRKYSKQRGWKEL